MEGKWHRGKGGCYYKYIYTYNIIDNGLSTSYLLN